MAPNSGPQLMAARYKFVASANTTGFLDEDSEITVSVFPNPVNSSLFIESNGIFDFEVTVSNTLSKPLLRFGRVNKIDFSDLPAGIYFLEIKNTNNQDLKRVKIIKN